MINLRGSVLAIIDLAERLGLPSVPSNTTSVVEPASSRRIWRPVWTPRRSRQSRMD
jgi:chemotaxis signal transduction protein